MAMFAFLLRNWFLSGIVLAIVFAKIAPGIGSKGGKNVGTCSETESF